MERCRPLVVGDARILERASCWLGCDPLAFERVTYPGEGVYHPGSVPILDMANLNVEACPVGQVTAASGKAAVEFVVRACDLALAHLVDAVVTAPLNKAAMNLAGFQYAGHTELLAERTRAEKVSMLLVGPKLRVVHVSTHVSLSEAIKRVTRERVDEVIELAGRSARELGIPQPRIAVAGLNPHAGEGGCLATRNPCLLPAIEAARARGWEVTDPQPPDTCSCEPSTVNTTRRCHVSRSGSHPMKLLAFDQGVNVSFGLPIIRPSVDHGKHFDIAGTGKASENSLLAAIDVAVPMVNARKHSP